MTDSKPSKNKSGKVIKLPDPNFDGNVSFEDALRIRRSVREFTDEAFNLAEVSQLLWAAQGINKVGGKRTAPSAGALYPLEIYLLAGNVKDIPAGVYKYNNHQHELAVVTAGDIRRELCSAALAQDFIIDAAINIVITAIYERTTFKYGQRGDRYVHMEVGHVAQNIHLQAAALNLGTVVVGAFNDDRVQELLDLPVNERPLCIMPVGKIQ